MANGPNWVAVGQLVEQIRVEEESGHFTSGLVLCFICLDTMAYLSRPAERAGHTRADFIAWTDKYLKGHPNHQYQYRGVDVYAARCAVLHTYGSEAAMHRADAGIKLFGYHDGGRHMHDPAQHERLVMIGLRSFLNDVRIAVRDFMEACRGDAELRARVEPRLGGLLTHMPFLPAGARSA